MSTYTEKFKDPRWQKLRLEIMGRDDFACQKCRSRDKTLNVHHVNYIRGREPWDYPAHNFATLCSECHSELEKAIAWVRRAMVLGNFGNTIARVASVLRACGPYEVKDSYALQNLLAIYGIYEEATMDAFAEKSASAAFAATDEARSEVDRSILDFAARFRAMFEAGMKHEEVEESEQV